MAGAFLKWLINVWLLLTGRVMDYKDYPWLDGPMADDQVIGDKFYEWYAGKTGMHTDKSPLGGLMTDFTSVIPDSDPLKNKLNPRIRHFYEHTVQYKLEVWSEWYAPISFFSKILIRSLSSKMEQFNIPLHPLETSRGMSNEILHLKDPATGALRFACWLRKSMLTGRVVYAGFYSGCMAGGKPYVRVVFPLPQGNVTVLLEVVVQEDGSVKLISNGRRAGDAGYYRVQRRNAESVRVRYIPLKEYIHVFEDAEGVLRTDHEFYMWKMKFLHLHYKIIPLAD